MKAKVTITIGLTFLYTQFWLELIDGKSFCCFKELNTKKYRLICTNCIHNVKINQWIGRMVRVH